MISINTHDSVCPDLDLQAKIARILSQELPALSLLSEPLDVIDSLEQLSDEMAYMPEIIEDCRLATEAFGELDQVIGHMYALADRAVELPEDRDRQLLDDEFRGYSHIVARLAGADDFDGPSLTLATKAKAISARKILSYLNDARGKFTNKLNAQRRQINNAMEEAMGMLAKIVSETDELSHHNRERLSEILDRLAILSDFRQSGQEERHPQLWLH